MKQKTKVWLRAAAVRAIKTMAQTALAIIGVATLISQINWAMVCSAAAVSGILSLITSVAGLPEVDE